MDVQTAPITADEWDILVDSGVLEGQRVELVGGRKVIMAPERSPHSGATHWIRRSLERQLDPTRYLVRDAHPLRLSDIDEPEPDLAVVDHVDDLYWSRHPEPRDTYLLIEVANSSQAFDLGEKSRRYAAAGIHEYWVVDLVAEVIVVHLDPDPETSTWRDQSEVAFGVPVRCAHLDAAVTIPPG